MLEQPSRNLLSFIAIEHENELVSTYRHREEMLIFQKIDGLYQAPIPYLDMPHGWGTAASLYQLVQYHLYASMTNLMRLHASEMYGCARKAIDAALSAYRILAEPESYAEYQSREWTFQTIAGFMRKERRKDPRKWPLAKPLLEAWDVCSEFGSHADVSTFVHRLETKIDPADGSKQLMYFQFFQQPESFHIASAYYGELFYVAMSMLAVFERMIEVAARDFATTAWSSERIAVLAEVMRFRRSAIDAAGVEAAQSKP